MKKRTRITFSIFPAFAALLMVLPPLPARNYRDAHPRLRKDMVREPEIQISEDVVVAGFWRPKERAGYRWINAMKDEDGRWHTGYWAPLYQYEMNDLVRTPGYWGPASREGYFWINIEDRVGEYPSGSWQPMNSFQTNQHPFKWVPGYWNVRRWVPGYWRIPEREDYIWIEGYYGPDGRWQEAHWQTLPEKEQPAPEM